MRITIRSNMSGAEFVGRLKKKLEAAAAAGLLKVQRSVRQIAGSAVAGRLSDRSAKRFRRAFTTTSSASEKGVTMTVKIGEAAKAIDEGVQAYDMKPGILAAAKKRSMDGTPYADVPLHSGFDRQGAPSAWRRVSGKSKALWRHPGTDPLHVLDEVKARIRERAKALVRESITDAERAMGAKK